MPYDNERKFYDDNYDAFGQRLDDIPDDPERKFYDDNYDAFGQHKDNYED